MRWLSSRPFSTNDFPSIAIADSCTGLAREPHKLEGAVQLCHPLSFNVWDRSLAWAGARLKTVKMPPEIEYDRSSNLLGPTKVLEMSSEKEQGLSGGRHQAKPLTFEFKKKLDEIRSAKGRGTELVSLYVPPSRQVHEALS